MPGKRIDINLLTTELKALINTAARIFPMPIEDIQANLNPEGYEYARILTGDNKNEIYRWDTDTWELIGADDMDIDWTDIKSKPSVYPPGTHNHVEADITDLDKYSQAEVDAKLIHNHDETYSQIGHIHDERYYTETEVDALLANKSAVGHIHDDRYYTESEIDAKLATKAELTTLNGHLNNSTVHVTQTNKDYWDGKSRVELDTSQPMDGESIWFKEV